MSIHKVAKNRRVSYNHFSNPFTSIRTSVHKIISPLLSIAPLAGNYVAVLPPPLEKGDLIAIVAPASYPALDEEGIQWLIDSKREWIEMLGFQTIVYPSIPKRFGYLAGTDEERAEALMDAWKNDEVKAIWCLRGGYGSVRILDLLDYEWIKDHPKIFLGMSDITALHSAIQKETNLVTFLAPVLTYFNDETKTFDNAYALESLLKILSNPQEVFIPTPPNAVTEVIQEGYAEGSIIGGNLTLIATLCGTKWQLNTDDKILLLEDVNESTYRIDRLLWQIQAAGLLDRPKAVILAGFEDCETDSKYSLTLQEIFKDYFGHATYPVLFGFPSGHGPYQATIPLNMPMIIDTTSSTS